MDTITGAPAGFSPHFRKSRLTDPWEPIFSKGEPGKVVIGLHVREAHCNSRGMVHGGLIAALADNAMGLSCVETLIAKDRKPEGGLVTISLATDFVGAAKLGQWVAFDTVLCKNRAHALFRAGVRDGGRRGDRSRGCAL